MMGYYKEPGMTKEAFTEDGWLKTGDLGYFDKGGNLYNDRYRILIVNQMAGREKNNLGLLKKRIK